MIDTIFDPIKVIQADKIASVVPKGREVICFGAGTLAEPFYRALSTKCHISCFVDNSDDLIGKRIGDVPVYKVDYLTTLERGNFFVLIIGKHRDAMCGQLDEFGLTQGTDYAFVHDDLKTYIRMTDFQKRCKEYEEFLRRDQDETLDQTLAPTEQNKTNKYGIICFGEIIKTCIFYPITECLMMHRLGYDVTLIVDTIPAFNRYVYFEDMEAVVEKYIDYFVAIIRQKYPDFKVVKLPKQSNIELTEEEVIKAKQFTERSLKRYNCEKGDERFLPEDPERESFASQIVLESMKCIKEFFSNNAFDVINIQAGAHKHRWPYMWYGEKKNIRMPSYDGSANITQNSVHGIPAQNFDIPLLIDGHYFTQEQERKLIAWAKQNAEERRHSTTKDPGYNYQTCSADYDPGRKWDIVIPLNIGWDAAAVGQERVFWSEREYLQETLSYLMEQTDATVIVREHPAQLVSTRFKNEDHSQTVPIIGQYPDRITYCRPEDKINTYRAIENCRVVLPYTSTTGMESAMMGKPVIIHTNAYYRNYVDNAKDKDDYFTLIHQYLYEDKKPQYDLDKLYLAYSLLMHRNTVTNWREKSDQWLQESIPALLKRKDVQTLMRNITEGIPNMYENVLDFLNEL